MSFWHYQGYTQEHKFKQHTGACSYTRDGICCNRLCDFRNPDLSVMWVLVHIDLEQILYANVSIAQWKSLTKCFTVSAARRKQSTVFLANSGVHHQQWLLKYKKTEHAGTEARACVLSVDLSQLMSCVTRMPDVSDHIAHCLDLLLITHLDRYIYRSKCAKYRFRPLRTTHHSDNVLRIFRF